MTRCSTWRLLSSRVQEVRSDFNGQRVMRALLLDNVAADRHIDHERRERE